MKLRAITGTDSQLKQTWFEVPDVILPDITNILFMCTCEL